MPRGGTITLDMVSRPQRGPVPRWQTGLTLAPHCPPLRISGATVERRLTPPAQLYRVERNRIVGHSQWLF